MVASFEAALAILLAALGIVLLAAILAVRAWVRSRRRVNEMLRDTITIDFTVQPGLFVGKRATKSADGRPA